MQSETRSQTRTSTKNILPTLLPFAFNLLPRRCWVRINAKILKKIKEKKGKKLNDKKKL